MIVRDLAPQDFELFVDTLHGLTNVDIEKFSIHIPEYPEDDDFFSINLDEIVEGITPSEESEIVYALSTLVDCVCLLEGAGLSLYFHFERGVVSVAEIMDESSEYIIFAVGQTVSSLQCQRDVVCARLLALAESAEALERFITTIKTPEVLDALAGDSATPVPVLKLLADRAGPAFRQVAETTLVRALLTDQQWTELETIFFQRDLEARLMTEVVEATDRFDLQVLGSGQVTPALVKLIAGRSCESSQLAVAGHRYASTEVLVELGKSAHAAVAQAAQKALVAQPKKVQQAADSGFLLDQVFAAGDACTTEASLLQLASSQHPAVHAALVNHPQTPSDALRAICATTSLPHLLLLAAAHRNFPADL